MSVRCVVSPVYRVFCDHARCERVFTGDAPLDRMVENCARWAAKEAGWQTRPVRGKGSRSAPDLCPKHAVTS